jgi:hypothetical protein
MRWPIVTAFAGAWTISLLGCLRLVLVGVL